MRKIGSLRKDGKDMIVLKSDGHAGKARQSFREGTLSFLPTPKGTCQLVSFSRIHNIASLKPQARRVRRRIVESAIQYRCHLLSDAFIKSVCYWVSLF